MWIICGLNDKNYTQPDFLFEELEEVANKLIIDTCMDFVVDDDYFTLEKEGDRCTVSCEGEYGEEFYVAECFKIEDDVEYILVGHHAYEGVEFDIEEQGTYEECMERFEQLKKEHTEEYEDIIDWEEEGSICFDTGNEWQLYNIIKVKRFGE